MDNIHASCRELYECAIKLTANSVGNTQDVRNCLALDGHEIRKGDHIHVRVPKRFHTEQSDGRSRYNSHRQSNASSQHDAVSGALFSNDARNSNYQRYYGGRSNALVRTSPSDEPTPRNVKMAAGPRKAGQRDENAIASSGEEGEAQNEEFNVARQRPETGKSSRATSKSSSPKKRGRKVGRQGVSETPVGAESHTTSQTVVLDGSPRKLDRRLNQKELLAPSVTDEQSEKAQTPEIEALSLSQTKDKGKGRLFTNQLGHEIDQLRHETELATLLSQQNADESGISETVSGTPTVSKIAAEGSQIGESSRYQADVTVDKGVHTQRIADIPPFVVEPKREKSDQVQSPPTPTPKQNGTSNNSPGSSRPLLLLRSASAQMVKQQTNGTAAKNISSAGKRTKPTIQPASMTSGGQVGSNMQTDSHDLEMDIATALADDKGMYSCHPIKWSCVKVLI
jgi:hypothetical protein